jgi:hypothetical protein
MSPKGTPIIGRPRSLQEREQQEAEAAIDAREAALDEAASSKPLDMSPEEIEALTREKQELAELLRTTRPAKPKPERSAPETISSRPITDFSDVAPERQVEVVEEPSTVVAEAEEELLALAQDAAESLDAELREYERQSAIEMTRMQKAGDAKRAEIRNRQEELLAKIAKERKAALPAEISKQAKRATVDAAANREREQSSLAGQRLAISEEWTPLLQAAKKTVAEVTALDKVFGEGLREMASMTAFTDTNSKWPTDLRQKFGQQVVLPAREVVKLLNNYSRTDQQDSPRDVIRQVEQLFASWTPGTPVANLRQLLSYVNADMVRHLSEQIDEINRRFEMIEAQGKAYIASGAVPAEIVILLEGPARIEQKEYMLSKHLHGKQQTHAVLDVGSVKPRADRADQ